MKIANTCNTTSRVYLDAVRIRKKVFVEEQSVPPEMELDENEARCIHFVLYSGEDTAVATARLLPNSEQKGLVTLQRMAVLKEYRGKGYGRNIIAAIEKFAAANHFSEIVLHAQVTAKDFYAKMGYLPFGDEFEEAGITHISMNTVHFCNASDILVVSIIYP
jgi:predicted GNAT family N-acyltransferase